MSYTINLTNGTKLTEIVDGSIDQSATDITLIGKNVSNYGTFLNDNMVQLLENFAYQVAPSRPLVGQLWYDTATDILKVYNGQGFAPTGNTVVSTSQPTNLASGTLWIDSGNKQLKFFDGVDLVTAGPIYTSSQGKSGFVVSDVIDTNQLSHTIVSLYVSNVLIGIYSNTFFTPANYADVPGFTAPEIVAGFNVGSQTNLTFDMQVSSALGLVDSNGVTKTTDSFMSAVDDTFATGTVSFLNAIPVILGAGEEMQVEVSASRTQFKSNKIDQDFEITTRTGISAFNPAIHINANASRVGIFTDSPTTTLDVDGGVRVRGNLMVEGTTTTINSSNLVIEDFQIEIGKVASPTDSTANGGGIILWGSSNKTFTWSSANGSWVSSEDLSLASSNKYRINGDIVLTHGSLGTSVVASSLTSVGVLNGVQVNNVAIHTNTISTTNTDGNLVLAPNGSGVVDVSNAKISNVYAPFSDTDAANKVYVDNAVKAAPLAISLATGTMTNLAIASSYLAVIFPAAEHFEATVCRAVCTDASSVITIKEYILTSGTWTFYADIATVTL